MNILNFLEAISCYPLPVDVYFTCCLPVDINDKEFITIKKLNTMIMHLLLYVCYESGLKFDITLSGHFYCAVNSVT